MLVLSRKNLEAVVVGGSDESKYLIKVTVLEIRGQTVRLGFEAAADIPINRWEVWQRICARPPPATLSGDPATPGSG